LEVWHGIDAGAHHEMTGVTSVRASVKSDAYPWRRQGLPRPSLRNLDVLRPRPLGTLTSLERDSLTFTEIIETRLTARGVVKEVLVLVTGQNETKTFVTYESFDCAVHGCHRNLL
jgi:hypothetical protein